MQGELETKRDDWGKARRNSFNQVFYRFRLALQIMVGSGKEMFILFG